MSLRDTYYVCEFTSMHGLTHLRRKGTPSNHMTGMHVTRVHVVITTSIKYMRYAFEMWWQLTLGYFPVVVPMILQYVID